jgi:chloramphenicol O-acetyltransferase type A
VSHYLDVSTWARRQHFALFREAAQPYFGVTVTVDVTSLVAASHTDGGAPFLIAALFHTLAAANAVPAFRLRMRLDRVRVHDAVRMSTTVMRDDGAYNYAVLEPHDRLEDFRAAAEQELARAKAAVDLTVPEGDGIIYHSTLPWLRFTSFTSAIRGAGECVPHVTFGQRHQVEDRWRMPVAVEVHHAVVDGADVAAFVERLQAGFAG